jgi:hypothetical protein
VERLADHNHETSPPFRLLRAKTAPTRAGLTALALMRRQEIDGFIEGIYVCAEVFGPAELVELPKRANQGIHELRQVRTQFDAVMAVDVDDAKEAPDKGLETTLQRIRDLTKIAEREINAVFLACPGIPTRDPILH